jgi:ACS family pantothenate transporter-like MFS transporter
MGICGSFGNGLSGIVQAIMLKTMDGVFGLSGWRWMFLFDASITLTLAVLGYKYLPDYPHNTTWLSDFEKKIAVERVSVGEKRHNTTTRFQKIKHLAKNKYLYLFIISWASLHIGLGAPRVLGIVSKKLGFDSVTSNLLTTVSLRLHVIIVFTDCMNIAGYNSNNDCWIM